MSEQPDHLRVRGAGAFGFDAGFMREIF